MDSSLLYNTEYGSASIASDTSEQPRLWDMQQSTEFRLTPRQALTFPTPVWPRVADLEDEATADPWYISVFFFTPGVARVVPVESFWHFAQTILKWWEVWECVLSGLSV